ncbi:MAG: hypothetical protein V8S99_04970 [Oscillospiraceae bacterium]
MNVLICNVGSTSLKYYSCSGCRRRWSRRPAGRSASGRTRGGFTRKRKRRARRRSGRLPHAPRGHRTDLLQLQQTVLPDLRALDCVGFKVVLARGVSGVQLLTDDVLARMEDFSYHRPRAQPAVPRCHPPVPRASAKYAAHRRV